MKKTKPIVAALITVTLLAGCAESRSTFQVDNRASTSASTATAAPQAMTTEPGSSNTSSQAAETTSTTGVRPNAPTTSAPSTTTPSTTTTSTTAPSTTIKPTTTKKPSSSTSAPATKTPTTTAPSTSAPTTAAPTTSAPASVSPKPGGVYPWFFVPAGQLAEAWGVTGTLIYAGDVVSVISTGANEAVVAVDSFDLRFASRYVGFDDVKVKREGGYTYVSFFCGGIETGGATARHYNVANTKAGALQVTYRDGLRTYDVSCGA